MLKARKNRKLGVSPGECSVEVTNNAYIATSFVVMKGFIIRSLMQENNLQAMGTEIYVSVQSDGRSANGKTCNYSFLASGTKGSKWRSWNVCSEDVRS